MITGQKVKMLLACAVALLAGMPAPLLACSACYGQVSNSALAQGYNWGIVCLLAIVFFVLAAISGFFIYTAKRSAALARGEIPAPETETTPQA